MQNRETKTDWPWQSSVYRPYLAWGVWLLLRWPHSNCSPYPTFLPGLLFLFVTHHCVVSSRWLCVCWHSACFFFFLLKMSIVCTCWLLLKGLFILLWVVSFKNILRFIFILFQSQRGASICWFVSTNVPNSQGSSQEHRTQSRSSPRGGRDPRAWIVPLPGVHIGRKLRGHGGARHVDSGNRCPKWLCIELPVLTLCCDFFDWLCC